ncbi:MAG: cytochrome c biogenesis protein ResB [Candidatus Competibacteraceae bacterium]|nr:cytochrome c biogenesis protein ResB [Candidatus Competibacteraceae bacterium]
MQLASFQQVEASGLQISHSAGAPVVYGGFALLIAGIFIMFYTSHRRLWAWLAVEDGATRLLLAGTGNRRQADFARDFAELRRRVAARLDQLAQPAPAAS